MENWGLITFRTKYLLYEEGKTSLKMKTWIAYVIAHEIAHQWFGNLVTMDWWSDLWLNESFATWIGWYAIDKLYPEWKIWESYYSNSYIKAMNFDKLINSHPIQNSVTKASQVNEIFDAITYLKGSCVIKMLVNHLGEEVFRKGLQEYLNKYKYKNATTENLWELLSNVSGEKVGDFMDIWLTKKGFPIINVTYEKDNINLKQEQYTLNGKIPEIKWEVPINVSTVDGVQKYTMSDITHTVEDVKPIFFINIEQNGFYKTFYSKDLKKMVMDHIKNKTISTIDRASIIDNMISFAHSGHCEVVDALEMLSAYEDEDEYIVWDRIVVGLNLVIDIWCNSELSEKVKQIGIKLTEPLIKKLGWEHKETDSYFTILLRQLLLLYNGLWGNESVVDESKKRFYNLVKNSEEIDSNIRSGIFKTVAKNGTEEDIDYMINYFNAVESDEIRTEIITALGLSKFVNKVFDFVFKSGKVRSQNAVLIASTPLQSCITDIWDYIEENWKIITKMYKGGSNIFGRLLSNIIKRVCNEDKIGEIKDFMKNKKDIVEKIGNTLKQSYECAEYNANWYWRDRVPLKKFIAKI